MTRPSVLVLIGALWPGNDSSGPNLSIRAQTETLADSFDFTIIARDRPFRGMAPAAAPARPSRIPARYLPVGRWGAKGLAALLRTTPHDVLHLNGFNDREFTIPALIARRLGVTRAPVLLSPRGEFSSGARALKSTVKTAYLALARTALLDGVTLHATSEAELADLRAVFPRNRIELITNFRPLFDLPAHGPRAEGSPLRIAYLGRIAAVKGTDIALRALARVTRPVQFDLYGPVQEVGFWAGCEALIAALPSHVTVRAMGEIANEAAAAMLATYDLMFLPSLSENFGHAIFEALAAGTPVLIGDQTPWRDLVAKQAGAELPTDDLDGFAAFIDRFAGFDAPTAAAWRAGARQVAEAYVASSEAVPKMRGLLNDLAGRGRA